MQYPRRSRRRGRRVATLPKPRRAASSHWLFDYLELLQKDKRGLIIGPFFLSHLPVEFAHGAIAVLLGKGTLDNAFAEGACDDPAGPAGVLAAVNTVEPFISCSRADA